MASFTLYEVSNLCNTYHFSYINQKTNWNWPQRKSIFRRSKKLQETSFIEQVETDSKQIFLKKIGLEKLQVSRRET